MKIKRVVGLLIVLIVTPHLLKGGVVIENFHLNSNSVSFTINGILPNLAPLDSPWSVAFVNPNPSASPSLLVSNSPFISSTSTVFTGTQTLDSVTTGDFQYGDYFYLVFLPYLSVGETISGQVMASWQNNAPFAPGNVSSIDVYWGGGGTGAAGLVGGTYLTTVNVPEPSSLSLLLAGGAVLAAARRRRLV